MATVKVKYRPSAVKDRAGTVYYQITHARTVRQLKTDYRIFAEEWDGKTAGIRTDSVIDGDRMAYRCAVRQRMERDIKRLNSAIGLLENGAAKYCADDVIMLFRKREEHSLFGFMQSVIARLECMGKYRTAEAYTAALRSFAVFRNHQDLLLEEMDSDLLRMYEAYLQNRGLVRNSISFYMRILRAVYNRAAEKELTEQRNPFRHVYTGIDKTVKRAVPLEVIRRLKELDLSARPGLEFARDMFLFSFYTRGMSFVDMAYLRKRDLQDGVLTYRRRKTGQRMTVKWEECMQKIVDKHHAAPDSPCLLPILTAAGMEERERYKNALHRVNYRLKEISDMLHLSPRLSMYVARHSWASIARTSNIPVAVISEGMGHDSETTTRIYLASLETATVDKANELILKKL